MNEKIISSQTERERGKRKQRKININKKQKYEIANNLLHVTN